MLGRLNWDAIPFHEPIACESPPASLKSESQESITAVSLELRAIPRRVPLRGSPCR